MLRVAVLTFLLSLGLSACADGGGPPGGPQFPLPNAASPSPNELRTCPSGVGCY